MGRDDRGVGARGHRVDREGGPEPEVRAPRLVHDQRHATAVGHLDQAGEVGADAGVRRRHDHGQLGLRGGVQGFGQSNRGDTGTDVPSMIVPGLTQTGCDW